MAEDKQLFGTIKTPSGQERNPLTDRLGVRKEDLQTIQTGTETIQWGISPLVKGYADAKHHKASIIGMAKQNVFEFPVFMSNTIPLDYATATNTLLEQVYGSYLQMALSVDPVVSYQQIQQRQKGSQFAKFKTDTTRYLECAELPYQIDVCHAEYHNNDGTYMEFDMVSIEDDIASVINEAMDYEPLSEFDHYFQEMAKDDKGNGGNGGENVNKRNLPPKKKETQRYEKTHALVQPASGIKYDDWAGAFYDYIKQHSDLKTLLDSDMELALQTIFKKQADLEAELADADDERKNNKDNRNFKRTVDADKRTDYMADREEELADKKEQRAHMRKVHKDEREDYVAQRADQSKALNMLFADPEVNAAIEEIAKQSFDDLLKQAKDKQKRGAPLDQMDQDILSGDKTKMDRVMNYQKQTAKKGIGKATIEAIKANARAKRDIESHEANMRNDAREEELHELKKKDLEWKTKTNAPEFIDETKIQKMNTMKPLMMKVQMGIMDRNGSVSRPIDYIVGVKTHCRLIDNQILPEVAEYPLKEMNKITRKAKWRSGEMKFFKDIVFHIKEKKQTAIDAKDPRRKWFRRLYELAHMKGDAGVSQKVTGTKTAVHGLIPNATIVISKADVDNIEAKTKIDLLNAGVALRFCEELFLMNFIVIDTDEESIKILTPDINNDFEVQSLAAVNKQIAQLDTAGATTRDVFKMLK